MYGFDVEIRFLDFEEEISRHFAHLAAMLPRVQSARPTM